MSQENMKDAADIAAGAVTLGALSEILPPVAAAFAILWTCVRLYEWARVVIWGKPPRDTNR